MAETKTLEEAFKALMHLMGVGTAEDIADGARALLLAGLEAVEATEGVGHEHGMGRWECDFDEVRRRIEELGR